MPPWVNQTVADYQARMPPHCRLEITSVDAKKRGKNADIERLLREQGQKLLAATPKGAYCVALDVLGQSLDTPQLAQRLQSWMDMGRDVVLWIGGADGLSSECLQRADWRWSLSPLTFAHPLVRVILAEQLYRAWSLTANLPYHRA